MLTEENDFINIIEETIFFDARVEEDNSSDIQAYTYMVIRNFIINDKKWY